MDRRQYLAACGAVGLTSLSGCWMLLPSSTEHQLADEGAWTTVGEEQGTRSQRIEGEVTLPQGRYVSRIAEPTATVEYTINVDVRDGAPMDVFFVDEGEYDRYREGDGDQFEFYQDLSEAEVTDARLQGIVSAGDYRILFDNTGIYGADPDGEVDANVTLAARV